MRNIRKEAQFHVCHLLLHGYLMFQAIDCKQDINGCNDNQQYEQDIQEIGERSFPERRKHLYIEQARIFRPYPFGIGGADLKHIMAFGQVGIGSHPLLAYVVPRLFKAFQNIGVLYFRRFRIVERRKLNGENILLVRERQLAGIVQALSQYRIRTRYHIFI